MLAELTIEVESEKAFGSCPQRGLSFIEQLQIVGRSPCTKEHRPYLIGVNENVKTAVLTKPACKMWNCEACAARNARIWIARIINGCNKLGGDWSFLTLTSHRKMRGLASVKSLREGWKKFYNRILARCGKTAKDIHYAKVWEQHSDGSFHLHILISVCFGKRWAKDNAVTCGLGEQADWHKCPNAGTVAGYIAKYSLKNATVERGGISWPKSLRRIETSRQWPKLPDLRASDTVDWVIKMSREEQIKSANKYHIRGFDILDMVKEPLTD